MSQTIKEIFSGVIVQDNRGNFHCGPYLLDYKTVISKFKLGDAISIKSVIDNTSDLSYNDYPKKSKVFTLKKDSQNK